MPCTNRRRLAVKSGSDHARESEVLVTALDAGQVDQFIFAFDETSHADRLSDRATDQLRTKIVTLALEPGAVLDEVVLSQQLDCGRTPLREAISRLAEERLVVVLPRRAAAVAPITVTDLQQIYEARLCVETTVARLAALRITATQLAGLERNVQAESVEQETSGALQVVWSDFMFHYLLARAANNQYLCDSVRRILGPAMRLTFLAHQHGQPVKETYEEHSAILRALASRDGALAEQEMRRHITMAKERTLRRL